MLTGLFYRLGAFFRRNAVESELNEELRFHLERQVEKLMRSGLTQEEAMRQGRLTVGGMGQVKEECRDARGVAVIETLVQGVRYRLRMLREGPGVTIMA